MCVIAQFFPYRAYVGCLYHVVEDMQSCKIVVFVTQYNTIVTRFAKRGLLHSQIHETLFIAIC